MFARVDSGRPSLKQLQQSQAEKYDEFNPKESDENLYELEAELKDVIQDCNVISDDNLYYQKHLMEREQKEGAVNGEYVATDTKGKPAGFRRA